MTTLIPALTNALSGLVTSKSAIDVISNNIANVNSDGYTRKLVRTEGVTLGGQGVGVQLATVNRIVDKKLQSDILTENGILSKLDSSSSYYQQIDSLFGNTADNNSISHLISDFSQALQTLADSPTAVAAQYNAGQEAQSLTSRFNTMSEQLQSLRLQADREIESTVGDVNSQLTLVKNLNDHILREAALGKTTADLEDQRDVALKDLSKLIDIRVNPQSDGTTMVFTTSGRPLIDAAGARLLTHDSINTLTADMSKAGNNISAITSIGVDLTSQIQGGALKALIDMRDTTLPNLQSELDTVAKQYMDDMNQINNRGVAFPTLQNTFNGSRSFADSSTSTISFGSGNTVVGLFNADGSTAAQTTIKSIMGGAGPYTVDAVAAGLQGWLQAQPSTSLATVAVDATSGKMNISLNTTSVGLAFRDQPMTEYTSGAYPDSNTNALGLATNLSFTDSGGTYGPVAVNAGMTLQDVVDAINVGVGGNGISASVVSDAGGYRLKITNTNGLDTTITDTGSSFSMLPTAAQADATIKFDSNGDGTTDETLQGFSNFFGLNDMFVDNHNNYIYDTPVRAANWTSTGGTLSFTDSTGNHAMTANIPANASLTAIAAQINADPAVNGVVTATVVPDGSGYRLRLTHADNSELSLTGTAVSNLGLASSAAGTGISMDVRSDIKSDPSLISRGAMVINSDSASMKYQLSEGDNTTIRAMVDKMSNSVQFSAAGNIGTGKYTYSDYAAAILSVSASAISVNQQNLDYQQPLNDSLETRQKNLSGVNLDEEMASLIIFQNAYQAASKVVSVTQKMMDILESIIQ